MIDVVVCGHIRSEIALYQILREVARARARGLVDQIVFATWESEMDRFPALAATLNAVGIDIATLDPPQPYTGSLPVQHMQFWRGLQALRRPDGWVLRTRTDKALGQTAAMFDALASESIDLGTFDIVNGVFDRKIILDAVSINEPFAHNDITMLMDKNDARRALNVDAAFDYVLGDPGYFPQEARWFVAPVMARHPQLKTVFEQISMHRLSLAIAQSARTGSFGDAPEALFQYLASYWAIADQLFGVVDTNHYPDVPSLERVLAGNSRRPWATHWGERALATNQTLLSALGNASLIGDISFARIAYSREEPDRFGQAMARLDLQALRDFCDAHLGVPPSIEPRVRIRHAGPPRDFEPEPVMSALMRNRSGQPVPSDVLGRLEATTEAERRTGNSDIEVLKIGRDLAEQARREGDRDKAGLAIMFLTSAAWARLHEAMDGACRLAHEGLVSKQQGIEAFKTVYHFFVNDKTDAAARFWYGIDHVYGWTTGGVVHEAPGLEWIHEAAEMDYEPAAAFLASYTPVGPS